MYKSIHTDMYPQARVCTFNNFNCANNTRPLGERLKSESKSGTGIADAVADAEAAQKMDDADEDDE